MESLLKYPAVKDVEGKTIDRIIFQQMRIAQLTILVFKDDTACYIIGSTIASDPVIVNTIHYDDGDVDVIYTDLGYELSELDLLNMPEVEKERVRLEKEALTEKAQAISQIEELEKKIKELKSNYNIV